MVDFVTLDFSYMPVQLVEGFQSMVWVERFKDHGEFRLVAPLSNTRIRNLRTNQFMGRIDSRYFMYIESIVEDEENGIVTVSGRSAESVLKYRPTVGSQYGGTDLTWTLASFYPVQAARAIAWYALQDTYADTLYKINGLTVTTSAGATIGTTRTLGIALGSDSYELIKGQLDEMNVGFKMQRTYGVADEVTLDFYAGTNRASTIVFSPAIDNLSNTIKTRSIENYADLAMVYQNNPTASQAYYYNVWVINNSVDILPSNGFGNRAVPVSMSGVASSGYEAYAASFVRAKHKYLNYVDGQVVSDSAGYIYGTDYNLGDVVGLNYNGVNSTARVIEHVTSVDSEGVRNYPTLEPV